MTGKWRLLIAGLCMGACQLLTLAALVAQEKSLPPTGIEIDDAIWIARADCDLVHIDIGRVQQRAGFGHRQHAAHFGPHAGIVHLGLFRGPDEGQHLFAVGCGLFADGAHLFLGLGAGGSGGRIALASRGRRGAGRRWRRSASGSA